MSDTPTSNALEESREQVNALVTEFYDTLPFPKVDSGDITRDDVDKGQELAEQVESLRIILEDTFTEGELGDMPRRKLQRIAKNENIKASQSNAVIVKALTGTNKSIRPRRQLREMFARLKLARAKLDYPHPRQTKE